MTSLIIIFLVTGIISGFMAGLLGVGGGIIIVPISYFVLLIQFAIGFKISCDLVLNVYLKILYLSSYIL